MSEKHPYTPAQGHLVQVIKQFRKSLPTQITAGTLKKLGLATKNESYILNILRFLGLIDQDGNRTEIGAKIFNQHDDDVFSKEFGKQVAIAYSDLFDLHAEEAWTLNADTLISFFRTTDSTTDLVGKLQAQTFQTLAAYSGHGIVPAQKVNPAKSSTKESKKTTKKVQKVSAKPLLDQKTSDGSKKNNNLGLTVRIEINLPSEGDQETYDRIFRSIRENLLNE